MILNSKKITIKKLAVKILYSEKLLDEAAKKMAINYIKNIFADEIRNSTCKEEKNHKKLLKSLTLDDFESFLPNEKSLSLNENEFVRKNANEALKIYRNFKKNKISKRSNLITELEKEISIFLKIATQIFMWWYKSKNINNILNPTVTKILERISFINPLDKIYSSFISKNFLPDNFNTKKLAQDILEEISLNDLKEINFSKKDKLIFENIFSKYIIHTTSFKNFAENNFFFFDLFPDFIKYNFSNFFSETRENVNLLYEDIKLSQQDTFFLSQIINTANKEALNIETIINPILKNWTIERLSHVDKITIQLGATEILFLKTNSKSQIITEYIETSKFFHAEESYKFINGILDKI